MGKCRKEIAKRNQDNFGKLMLQSYLNVVCGDEYLEECLSLKKDPRSDR